VNEILYEQTALPGFEEQAISGKKSSQEVFEDYDGFVEKFKAKKTTDDCYTPDIVYDAVAGWVEQRYGVNRADFIRPFYPENDYRRFDYTGKIVVDNPPFSLLAQIIDFYRASGVRFFLFAPLLTSLKHVSRGCTFICCDASITYENGAVVNTTFLTDLDTTGVAIMTCRELQKLVEDADAKNRKAQMPPKPSYRYPPEVVSIALLTTCSRHGVDVVINRDEIVPVEASRLDSQRAAGKSIFGGAYFVSHQKGAELDEARRQVWELSPRELEIIESLEKKEDRSK
jgi:hypothetical protein